LQLAALPFHFSAKCANPYPPFSPSDANSAKQSSRDPQKSITFSKKTSLSLQRFSWDLNPKRKDSNPMQEDLNPAQEDLNLAEKDLNPVRKDLNPA
jgi:hypothetical protein